MGRLQRIDKNEPSATGARTGGRAREHRLCVVQYIGDAFAGDTLIIYTMYICSRICIYIAATGVDFRDQQKTGNEYIFRIS